MPIERTPQDLSNFDADMRRIAESHAETRGEFVRRNADEMAAIAARTIKLDDGQRAYIAGVLYGFALRMLSESGAK